jgi:hypothetical protein
MKFFKLDLLTLLISLFILSSCKNQDSIGLGVTNTNQLSGNLIDTATIIVNTIPEDTVITNIPGANAQLGFFKDPVFGNTEANMVLDLNLPGLAAYKAPVGTNTIDSAILVLRYARTGFYGDSLASRYKVNVYQLGERISTNASYYNTRQWKYNSSTLLGTQTFFSRTHDSISLAGISTGKKNIVKRSPAQLRIPIDKNFIYNNLFLAGASQLGSNLVFKNNVNGLYVTLDKTGVTGTGGIFQMAPDSAAEIDIFYRNVNGTTIDTTEITMTANSTYATQFKHTYSPAVQTELNNTTTGSRNVIYLQGLAGLRAKISFPYIKNLVKSLGSNIVINRAELIITPAPGTGIPFPPLPQLSLYRYDIANTRTYIEDENPSDPRAQGIGVFGGYFSTSLQDYHFVITAYIQDLLLGKIIDYGTFIGARNFSIGSADAGAFVPTTSTSARTIAVGTDKTSPYRIKLNIIYTKLPKQ